MSFSRVFLLKTPKTHARDVERWYSSFWHGLVHYICIDRVSVKGASLNSLSRIWPSPWYIRYTIYTIYQPFWWPHKWGFRYNQQKPLGLTNWKQTNKARKYCKSPKRLNHDIELILYALLLKKTKFTIPLGWTLDISSLSTTKVFGHQRFLKRYNPLTTYIHFLHSSHFSVSWFLDCRKIRPKPPFHCWTFTFSVLNESPLHPNLHSIDNPMQNIFQELLSICANSVNRCLFCSFWEFSPKLLYK